MYIIEKWINGEKTELLKTNNLEKAVKEWQNIPEWTHYWDSEQNIEIEYKDNKLCLRSFMECYDEEIEDDYFYFLKTI